jgi:periplasmic divalent cation tolerance protein
MNERQNDTNARMVYVTCPDTETARTIASALVEYRLAACVNIVPGLESVYRWQGKIEIDTEVLLLIKTQAERVAAVQTQVEELHPDDVPEVVAVPIVDGSKAYLDWLDEQTRPQ